MKFQFLRVKLHVQASDVEALKLLMLLIRESSKLPSFPETFINVAFQQKLLNWVFEKRAGSHTPKYFVLQHLENYYY